MPVKVVCPHCAKLNEVHGDVPEGMLCASCRRELPCDGESISGVDTVGEPLGEPSPEPPQAPEDPDEGRGPGVRAPPSRAAGEPRGGTGRAHYYPGDPVEEDCLDDTVGREDTVGARRWSKSGGGHGSETWHEGSTVAGRFRIQRFLGKGGMGNVYLAEDETLKRPTALKRVPQEIIFDVDARDDLRQEANRLLDLAHENIVRIHTYYDGPTWPFFAMEYLEGPTLKELLRERRRAGRSFSPAEVLLVARQVGAGLAHAHARNVVHRDLKPANLMLAQPPGDMLMDKDEVKITDFGISRVVAESTLRQTGQTSGTLPYMSPEQFRGEPPTEQSDVYSLACTLYELVAGRPPFFSGDIGYQILKIPPKGLPGIPKHMADAILWGLAKEPRDRCQSIEQFLSALEGDCRRPPRFLSCSLLSLGSKVLLGLVFVVLTVVLVAQLFGPRSGAGVSGRLPDTSFAREPAGARKERQRDEFFAEIGQRLEEELSRQLPRTLGSSAGVLEDTVPPELSLSLSFPESAAVGSQSLVVSAPAEGFPRELLSRLVLWYSQTSPGEQAPHEVRGAVRGGSWIFDLRGLGEGTYELQAYLEETGTGISHRELTERPHRFQVDLTPPRFQVLPGDSNLFMDRGTLCTFESEVELAIVSDGGVGDLAQVFSQAVYGDQEVSEPKLIENPTVWKVELPTPGVQSVFRLVAWDAAGNRSDGEDVGLRRYRLGVQSLEASVSGRTAVVTGSLVYEGDVSPSLVFFVNDRPKEAPLVTREMPAMAPKGTDDPPEAGVVATDGASSPQVRELPFETRLALDQVVNTIEVRYSWRASHPRRFVDPARLVRVAVRPPDIALEASEVRTRGYSVTVRGSVEPYFEGLEIRVTNEGRSDVLVDGVIPDDGMVAVFEQEVPLHEYQDENRISAKCLYNGSPLPMPAGQQILRVYRDETSPTCHGVEFEPFAGDETVVRIEVSERLRELRARAVSAEGETVASEELEPVTDTTQPVYVWRINPFRRPAILHLELTDLAGNIGRAEHEIPFSREMVSGAGVVRATVSEEEAVGVEGNLPERFVHDEPARRFDPRSKFLREVNMDFIPFTFGRDRIEMSKTEVTERAWWRFLREEQFEPIPPGEGRLDFPMVVGDHPPEILPRFVEWFEQHADDGYSYSIPTVSKWQAAFAGTADPADVEEDMADWFARRFVETPRIPYAANVVGRVGSRPENATRLGFLDMESNVQEIVYNPRGIRVVIGANYQSTHDDIEAQCLFPRKLEPMLGDYTGIRLCREPAGAP